MTIKYKDLDNPDYEEGSKQIVSTPINVDVKPTFTYYDNQCIPFIVVVSLSRLSYCSSREYGGYV